MYWLDIQNGPSPGRRCVQRRVYTLGSDLSCQLWVRDASVAPRQVDLIERDAGVMVRPIDPADAVHLNGRPVDGETLLSDGDTLTVGPLRIRFRARVSPVVRAIPHVLRMGLAAGLAVVLGYGFWRYLRHRAGLDGLEAASALPHVFIPPAPPVIESPELKAMERIGSGTGLPDASISKPSTEPRRISPSAEAPSKPPPVIPPSTPSSPAKTPPIERVPVAVPPQPSQPEAPADSIALRMPVDFAPSERTEAAPESVGEVMAPVESPAPSPSPVSEPEKPAPPPSPPPPSPPPLPPVVNPTEIAVKQVRALMEAGQWDLAAGRIEEIAREHPDFVPGIAAQARLAEHQGRIQDAEKLWTRILKEAMGHPLYDEAFAELVRLANLRVKTAPPSVTQAIAPASKPSAKSPAASSPVASPVEPTKPSAPPATVAKRAPPTSPEGARSTLPPSAPAVDTGTPAVVRSAPVVPPVASRPPPATPTIHPPQGETAKRIPVPAQPMPASATTSRGTEPKAVPQPAAVARAPSVRVRETNLTRFPASREYDDFRLLEVALEMVDAEAPLAADRVSVEVMFFDRFDRSGEIVPSRAAGSIRRVRVEGEALRQGESRSVTVPYQVPANTRASSEHGTAGTGSYYGHRVRVLVDGRLVHEMAKPSNLP